MELCPVDVLLFTFPFVVVVVVFFFFSQRYLLTSPALCGNIIHRWAVAGLSLEMCQLSES